MRLAILHMKSGKEISVIFPWNVREWSDWLALDRYGSHADKTRVLVVSDDKGNQYAVCADEVEFVVCPNPEED